MNDENLKPFDSERAREAGKKSKRGVSLKRALIEMLQKEADENGKLSPDNIVKMMVAHGIKGNTGMMRLIWEYIEGKVADTIKHEGKKEIVIMTEKEKALYDKYNGK